MVDSGAGAWYDGVRIEFPGALYHVMLERIVQAVAESFGTAPSCWSTGRRSDDASRAVAAFLARRRYGYRATEVAKALGYASHGGVVTAIRKIESAGPALRRTVHRLQKRLTND